MKDIVDELSLPINPKIFACPIQDCRTSFQLVDEFGQGEPYAGLGYEAIDREGVTYQGVLDVQGKGTVIAHYSGGLVVTLLTGYIGVDEFYTTLIERKFYPLKITELQVRAEATRFRHEDGSRSLDNPAQALCDHFFQVEVRDLVRYACHLPPPTKSNFPLEKHAKKLMRGHGAHGVCLRPNQHTVLEVRPLRALRLVLSKDPGFCVLNMYQLALMATLSYSPFGQEPDGHPVRASTVSFPLEPSVGNWFAESLSAFREIWRVDTKLTQSFYPFYEEVPYSQRWEIAPFDPDLYPYNHPEQRDLQEHPAKLHFLDDRNRFNATDTQAFIVHTPDQMLIAIRGTSEFMADALRDADALQVEFNEGEGRVHRGFYESAMQAYNFVREYMDRFHTHQRLVICGHSLGGAVALLLAEMLRRQTDGIDIQLYTFGAPAPATPPSCKALPIWFTTASSTTTTRSPVSPPAGCTVPSSGSGRMSRRPICKRPGDEDGAQQSRFRTGRILRAPRRIAPFHEHSLRAWPSIRRAVDARLQHHHRASAVQPHAAARVWPARTYGVHGSTVQGRRPFHGCLYPRLLGRVAPPSGGPAGQHTSCHPP